MIDIEKQREECDRMQQRFEKSNNPKPYDLAIRGKTWWDIKVAEICRTDWPTLIQAHVEALDEIKKLRRIVQIIGVVTQCKNCDGSGYTSSGSACCRITGHAEECLCVVCQWMRSYYHVSAEKEKLRKTGKVLARFARDHIHLTEDADLEACWVFEENE